MSTEPIPVIGNMHVVREKGGLSRLPILLLALFPVIPSHVANGAQFLIPLILAILVVGLVSKRRMKLPPLQMQFILLAMLLFMLESITYLFISNTTKDFYYLMGRFAWILTGIGIFLSTRSWVQDVRVDYLTRTLTLAFLILLPAMFMESMFYPHYPEGRSFGGFTFPYPRATGVPNSDGKLGTFFVLALMTAVYLFRYMPKWTRYFLLIAPFVGLSFTQSRSTMLAFVTALGIYFLGLRIKNIKTFLLKVAVIPLTSIITAYKLGTVYTALLGTGVFEQNVYSRIEQISEGLRKFYNSGLFGGGIEATVVGEQYIHNTFLFMAAKSGILASFILLILIVYPAFKATNYEIRLLSAAISTGFITEHLLYPGYINEFIIIYVLSMTILDRFASIQDTKYQRHTVRRHG